MPILLDGLLLLVLIFSFLSARAERGLPQRIAACVCGLPFILAAGFTTNYFYGPWAGVAGGVVGFLAVYHVCTLFRFLFRILQRIS